MYLNWVTITSEAFLDSKFGCSLPGNTKSCNSQLKKEKKKIEIQTAAYILY